MAEISELWIYPVKSIPGVSVQRADVGPRGLRLDRHWMLVDTDGKFITQREDVSLVRFRLELSDDGLEVRHPDAGCCRIPMQATGPTIETHVWKSDVDAQLVDPAIDAWFTKALGRECRLVVAPDDSPRKIHPDYGDFPLSFVDAMPILVLSESSVSDLSARTFENVPFNRFRANIILKGTSPFQEDSTLRLRAGGVSLVGLKRCGRCLVICTDQETGERGVEPLTTLANYRSFGQNACMGMYFAPEVLGTLEVGQPVLLE